MGAWRHIWDGLRKCVWSDDSTSAKMARYLIAIFLTLRQGGLAYSDSNEMASDMRILAMVLPLRQRRSVAAPRR